MSRKTDSEAQKVKRIATMIMMAPTAVSVLRLESAVTQPLPDTDTHTDTHISIEQYYGPQEQLEPATG